MQRNKLLAAVGAVLCLAGAASAGTQFYQQTNLVSDGSVPAVTVDKNLINPWGIAYAPGGPFWIANNNSNTSTLYDGTGSKIPLTVNVPGNPTGQVFNSTSDFSSSTFIFDGEGGTVTGWNGGTTVNTLVDNSAGGAVYKGLANGTSGGQNFLYAANFHSGKIDVFAGNNVPATLSAGAFTDPTLPAGYAPFDIQNINGKLYVTYALQNAAAHDDVSGAGHGFVDVFSTDGANMGRLISQGVLNSPWGIAQAPANFGKFSNDLLVGNFGDGKINAFDPITGAFLGSLSGSNGKPIDIQDLWALKFGNGGEAGQTNQLFFTAGLQDESQGLFGRLDAATGGTAVPLPNMLYVLPFALAIAAISAKRMTAREA